MPIYEEYAHLYDRSGQLGFSMRMLHYIDQLLENYPATGNRLLDLACGTGTFAIGMALKGWYVQGIDGSSAMLDQARAKMPADVTIHWSQQDMRKFTVLEPVHLVTCLYDSLNYMLTDDDLVAVFRQVYAALFPGGLLIFDMNTAWVMASHWDDASYVTDTDNLTTIMQTTYNERRQRTTVNVICFERQGDSYRKSKEQHVEQAYPLTQVTHDLSLVGFTVEAMLDCFTLRPAQDNDDRVLWIARKTAIDDSRLL
ncbi:MAG: class I SAM-dependent DNA methyltransferase [Anaerolineae bacterium]